MIKLSLLIPTIVGREEQYDALIKSLWYYKGKDVEICTFKDNREKSIGEKRNSLIWRAKGMYVAFIDDDDAISPTYVEHLLKAVESGCDCASLKGMYSVDGRDDGIFEHSLKYNEWRTTNNEVKYERYPNHLNCINADIAKRFKFPETNFGEDHDWSKQVHQAKALKTEYYIPEIIYYYKFRSKK